MKLKLIEEWIVGFKWIRNNDKNQKFIFHILITFEKINISLLYSIRIRCIWILCIEFSGLWEELYCFELFYFVLFCFISMVVFVIKHMNVKRLPDFIVAMLLLIPLLVLLMLYLCVKINSCGNGSQIWQHVTDYYDDNKT